MDTTRRTLAKALSWQLMGLVSMTALGAIFTGSAGIAGALALSSAALGTVCYVAHEKLWAIVPWGRAQGGAIKEPLDNSRRLKRNPISSNRDQKHVMPAQAGIP